MSIHVHGMFLLEASFNGYLLCEEVEIWYSTYLNLQLCARFASGHALECD